MDVNVKLSIQRSYYVQTLRINKGREEKKYIIKVINRRNLTISYIIIYIYQSNYQILQDQWNLHPKMILKS